MKILDILAIEKSILEVKRSTNIVLLPNSITFQPENLSLSTEFFVTPRIKINVRYATVEVVLLITLTEPLDFVVLSPLLPMKYFDDKPFPPEYPTTSLKNLLIWIMRHLRTSVEDQVFSNPTFNGLDSFLQNLISMNMIGSKDDYEIALADEKVIVIIKFKPSFEIDLTSVSELVQEDKLLNTGGHNYFIKIAFRNDTGAFLPGEFSLLFSPDISSILPELSSFSAPEVNSKLSGNLLDSVITVQEAVDKALKDAVRSWKERAALIMVFMSLFDEVDIVEVFTDGLHMSKMDLAFSTKKANCLLKIELPSNYPTEVPKVSAFYSLHRVEGGRETRSSGEVKEVNIDTNRHLTSNIDNDDFVKYVLTLIRNLAAKFDVI